MLLYAASSGSLSVLTSLLLDHHVPINSLVTPGVCLDCDPICLMSECRSSHGIGMETALMAAALSGQKAVAEALCSRGADVNVQNEVTLGTELLCCFGCSHDFSAPVFARLLLAGMPTN